MMKSPTAVRGTQVALGPGVCPQCEHLNSPNDQFCTRCHYILIYRCPKCWHEQRHGHICDACHLDMDRYWQVFGATEQAALIQDEATNMEKSAARVEGVLSMLGAIPLQLLPFLEFLGIAFLIRWLHRRFPYSE
jgi:hypothetical protein